ncbi:MAG: hypothetical protein VX737_00570 [Pseudomonadota bacterium]|nr:hypothetical protein [Pseudomonadota bacterium]
METAYETFEEDTQFRISQEQKYQIIDEIRNNKRELRFPSDFENELTSIRNELTQKETVGILGLSNQTPQIIRAAGAASLQSIALCLASVQFGATPIMTYYIGANTWGLIKALKKTHQQSRSQAALNITHDNCTPSAFSRFILNFCKQSLSLMPMETAFLNLTDDHSANVSGANLIMAMIDYISSLSHEGISSAISDHINISEKTCFTTLGKNEYITANIDEEILQHFKHSLRKLARIVDDELPPKIEQDKSTSWIKRGIQGLRRLVEPLMLPLRAITLQGEFNPLNSEIVILSESINQEQRHAEEQSRKKKKHIRIMIRSAKELYQSQEERKKAMLISREHTEMISKQHEIIQAQEDEIARLKQLMSEQQPIHQISANRMARHQ